MANRRPLFLFLFIAFGVLTIASCLFLVLWKLGIGEWAFLAGVVCAIVGTTALLYVLSQIEKPETKAANRRIGFLLSTWLVLMAAGILSLALWKTGAGEWAASASMLFMGIFMFGPPVWFVIQPDLAITTFNVLTGNINASDDWNALSPFRRFIVYAGTLLFLAIGILLLLGAFHRLALG